MLAESRDGDQQGVRVIELFLESHETSKDGLLESCWIGGPLDIGNEQRGFACNVIVEPGSDTDDNEVVDEDWSDVSASISPVPDEMYDCQAATTDIQTGCQGYMARKLFNCKPLSPFGL